jgi:hypothetical protein
MMNVCGDNSREELRGRSRRRLLVAVERRMAAIIISIILIGLPEISRFAVDGSEAGTQSLSPCPTYSV